MTKITKYHFGYVLEKVRTCEVLLQTFDTPYVGQNIFGQDLLLNRRHWVYFTKFLTGEALSMPYKTKQECENFRRLYEQNI